MKKKTIRILLAISLCMVLIGSIVGGLIQTSFGTVDVQKVSWVTDDGATLSALLYIPKGASAEEPLPAVVSCHGWNNTAEVQGMNCIELSRRGYVVIAVDAYGHGDSTFPVGTMTDDDMADGVEDGTVATGADGSALVADMGVYSALQYLGTLPLLTRKTSAWWAIPWAAEPFSPQRFGPSNCTRRIRTLLFPKRFFPPPKASRLTVIKACWRTIR